jgi:hypothetical protein
LDNNNTKVFAVLGIAVIALVLIIYLSKKGLSSILSGAGSLVDSISGTVSALLGFVNTDVISATETNIANASKFVQGATKVPDPNLWPAGSIENFLGKNGI